VLRHPSDLESTMSSQSVAFTRSQGGLDLSTRSYDAFVLDAALRQSLVSIRSLGQRNLAVAALEAEQRVPAFSSRWCQQGVIAPTGGGSKDYLNFLEQWLECTKVRVLIASSDSTVALIRQYRDRLEKHTAIALAQDPALAIAINKEQTLEIARQLGLHIPRGVTVSSVHEVTAALNEIGLPAVIKPIESWLWDTSQTGGARFAAQLVTTADEARIAVEDLTRLGGTTLFQQFLTGRREAISLLYAKHKVHASFAQWAKRTEPPLGGTSVLRQSIALPPDIGDQAERLVREIDLEGYSEVEFRRDRTGIPYLMEINPRLSASVEIAVRSGVDFPYLIYQWAAGERIDTVKSYRVGGWMRYLKGDIMTTIEAVQQRGRPGVSPPTQAVLGFALSCLKPMHYDGVAWNDLAPAIQATAEFTRDWVGGAILKRLARMQRSFS
jgi:predicted ATP-grasp superfamily ATP-dependent carboligase